VIGAAQPKSEKPPLLESVIRFLVWFTILGFIATPAVVVLTTYGRVLGNWRAVPEIPPLAQQNTTGPVKPVIVTGLMGEERARQIARLKALTGRPEQASGIVSSLQIIAVAFDRTKPGLTADPVPTNQSVDDDGYRRLTLDLDQVPHDAVVIIADQPIRWRVQGLAAASPRLGFEGHAAFDVADVPPGSLAGFRIGAFGASGFARALDPAEGEVSIRQAFCSSLQNWADHFGLAFDAVRFTLLLNPSRITPGSGAPQSDGGSDRVFYGSDLDRLCKQRLRG
jgi:hypothetical protein